MKCNNNSCNMNTKTKIHNKSIKSRFIILIIVLTLCFTNTIEVMAAKPENPGKSSSHSVDNPNSNASSKSSSSNASSNLSQSRSEASVSSSSAGSNETSGNSDSKNQKNVGGLESNSDKLKNNNGNGKENGIGNLKTTQAAVNVDVIIIYKKNVDIEKIKKNQGNIKKNFKNIPAAKINIPADKLKELESDPNILSIEEDQIVELTADTIDWGTNRIQAPTTWSGGFTGRGIKIAIIDTGIALHSDLEISGGASFTDYTTSYYDDNGHGTHVAGIAAARSDNEGIVGTAPDASLFSVKVLGSDGSGYLSDVIAGIDWAIANDIDIINLSLGMSTDSPALHQIIDTAYSRNILVVAATGNTGTAAGIENNESYPARYSSVIAVAATDQNDMRASFSSTGSQVEIAAPGTGVISTYLNGQYVKMSGTSMAAPFVTGQLALLKEAHPNLTASDLRGMLHSAVVDLGTVGRDAWYGYGLIQSFAVKTIDPISVPVTIPNKDKQEQINGKPKIAQGKERKQAALSLYTKDEMARYSDSAQRIGFLYKDAKVLDIGSVAVKNNIIKFDTPAYVKGGRTIVPVRAITEQLGANVSYDSVTRTVTISKDDTQILLTIDSKTAIVNGVTYQLDAASEITNNRTYVPLRFIAETLGLKVDYEPETDSIDIL